MSARLLLAYLIVAHVAVLALGFATLRERPGILLSLEVASVASFIIGLALWRRQRATQRLLRDGTAALRDQDYSLRLREVGVRDVDELIGVYNALLAQLRSERLDAQRQQFFLNLLIESTALGVVTLDFDGNLEHINTWGRAQLGLGAGAVLPRSASSGQAPGLRDIPHPLAQQLATLAPEEQRLIRLPDNRRYRCESAHFVDRGFRRRFLVVNDISGELTGAEVAAYGQVIRMMAHEVNNTTAMTRSVLQSLQDTADLDDAAFRSLATEYMPLLEARGEDLNAFMRRFADVVRLPDPVLAPVRLDELLASEARLAEEVCRGAGVAISLSLKPVTVHADAELMRQVVTNALTNARESIEATGREEGGTIRVSCADDGFEIADDGAGIDAEAAGQLFTPFFSTKATGQGIGLTVMRDVLERHGARYSLATGADGWTRLRVRFGTPAEP